MKKTFSSKIEQETSVEKREYFSTPNTAIENQKDISRYDNFDNHSEAYQKSESKMIVEKYVVLRKS